jgi:tight adherence protein C
MNFPVLNFFAVAPLLYLGIWLIAQESLLGSERLANYMKGVTSPGRGKDSTRTRNFEYLTLVTTILLLVLLAILVIALNYVKTPLFVLITICTLAAWLQKKKLKDQQDAWQGRLDSELPGLIQMLTLMIASGISPLRAIELIALDTKSELSSELLQILERVRQGDSSSQALDAFARRVNTLDARRFSNAISMALERGSPLIPVLSALVGDARNEEKVRLLRRVGKAEIALMVPVVFLLLPISVLFALFPSFLGLQMF